MSIETIAYALCIENATAFGGKVFKLYCAGLKKLKDDAVPYAFTGQGELFSFKAAGKVYVPYRTGSVHWGYAPQGIRPTEADRYRFEAVNGEAVAVVAVDLVPLVGDVAGLAGFIADRDRGDLRPCGGNGKT